MTLGRVYHIIFVLLVSVVTICYISNDSVAFADCCGVVEVDNDLNGIDDGCEEELAERYSLILHKHPEGLQIDLGDPADLVTRDPDARLN